MHDVLEMTYVGEHRQDGFDEQADLPFASLAHLEILRLPVDLVEALIGKDDPLILDLVDEVLEGTAVVDMGCITVPVDH